MTTITCSTCNVSRDAKAGKAGPRLPMGWKRHADKVWCAGCWRKHWAMRGIVMPIASPVGIERKQLNEILAALWRDSTRLANWATTALYQADVRRGPDSGVKMPAMPRVYLYPQAREQCPAMDPQSVVALLHAVERKYRARRYNVVWTQSESLPNWRYPAPYPVHNQSWSARLGDDNEPLIDVRVGGQRLTLRLRGGKQFARQIAAFRRLVNGELLPGELSIYRKRVHDGDHRPQTTDRDNSGGPSIRYQTVVRMALWMPKTMREREGQLVVRTGGDALLAYLVEGDEPRYIYADHAKRLAIAHRKRISRLSHDMKAEKRRPRSEMAGIRGKMQELAAKHRRAMDSITHEAAASVAKYADRRGVASVLYDDTDRSFLPEFPWHELSRKLEEKLDAIGVTIVTARREPEARTKDVAL